MYSVESERITSAMEFHLDHESNPPIPTPSWLCEGDVVGKTGPTWEIAYNHYFNRMNISLPFTKQQVLSHRPTKVDLMMVWETLTHAEMKDG